MAKQQRINRLASKGLSNKEIANKLNISRADVRSVTGGGRAKAATPVQSNELTQFGNNGNFGAAALNNARQAGMTTDQIRGLTAGSGLNIGSGVDAVLNPGKYDEGYTPEAYAANPYSVAGRGLYGGGLPSQDGKSYGLEGFVVPGATNGIGPNKNVLFMAGPSAGNTYAEKQDWLNSRFGPGGRYYGGAATAAAAPGTEGGDASTATDAATPAAVSNKDRLKSIKQTERMRQALKIAASNDMDLSAKESRMIERKFGKNAEQQVAAVDKLNAKNGKKRGLVGLSKSFVNQYYDNKLGANGFLGYGSYGDGPLSQALSGIRDRSGTSYRGLDGSIKNTGDTKGSGKIYKGLSMYGYADNQPLYRERGKGSGYGMKINSPQAEAAAGSSTPGNTTGSDTTSAPMTPEQMEAASTGPGSQLGGGLGRGGAKLLKRARSRIQKGNLDRGVSLLTRAIQYGNYLN